MPNQLIPIDESVRQLTEDGVSTRAQARMLHVGQSTIIRAQQRINTGPNPILPPGYRPERKLPRVPAMAAVAVTLILLAIAAVTLVMARLDRAPARQQVQACVRYDRKTSDIAGITAWDGSCPPGWQAIVLAPAG